MMIMVSGSYSALDSVDTHRISSWLQDGGTLYAQRTAVSWAIRNNLGSATSEKFEDEIIERKDYELAREYSGARRIGGSVFLGQVDITHPIAFGITKKDLPVYRNHSIFLEPSKDPYNTVIKYSQDPHLAGYLHPDNLEKLRNRSSLLALRKGQGHVILNTDNPNFRAYWFGTSKLLFNSVFFGYLY